MGKKVVIIGGVAGGASAAARLRRMDEQAEIILLERGEYISFANCGLPYYIGGVISERERLLVQTPAGMKKRFKIDVRTKSDAVCVDTENKTVKIVSEEKGEYTEAYDFLILSPGAKPLMPPIEGIESDKIFTLRNMSDTDKIKSSVEQGGVKSAIVIGGGFIGIEMAENLRHIGIAVTLIEAAPHILAPFDSDMSVIAEKELCDNGVSLILSDGVKRFESSGDGITAELNSGEAVSADIAVFAAGVVPDTDFLKESGIQLGAKGHIVVNEYLETNADSVYAVGDAIETVDFVTKQKTAVPLAGPANKQGRIAADNICGRKQTYKGAQGTAVIKVFSLTAASTGANERTLSRLGIEHKAVTVHPLSHAGYYPGATQMTLKLIFGENGNVLGAQAMGKDGVEKRIDVISTVIRLGGSVYDLTELELCYAPPFSSAKDPVNIAGYVACNYLEKIAGICAVSEIDNNKYTLLDTRTEAEYNMGHIEGAMNIPVDELRENLDLLDKSKPIQQYCQVGLRGHVATRILAQNGFDVKNITGGYKSYVQSSFKPI